MSTPETVQTSGLPNLPNPPVALPADFKRQASCLAVFTALLAGCFSLPLLHLLRFTLGSALYSHILLVPFISIYLGWTKKNHFAVSGPQWILTLAFAAIAMLLLGCFGLAVRSGWGWTEEDRLCVLTLSFVFSFFAGCAAIMGTRFLRLAAFPLGFLLFMAPLPTQLESGFEAFLQHRSADVAYWFLNLSGTPVLRTDTVLQIPGIILRVAPECSGIRSTLVLILTGLLAGHFFLKRPLNKVLLVLAVIVLGILRNAFRIFTLAQLCIHISPSMIDSPVHHRGGPVFFVISLIPLLYLIWYLRRVELRKSEREKGSGK